MLRRTAIASIIAALGCASLAAADGTISARLASAKMPTPTFQDVHSAYTRLVVNESGFKSVSDQEGILKALLFGGGGRDKGRTGAGTGWGLDYTRMMSRMVNHSTRTFPIDSKFLVAISPEKLAHKKRLRTYQNGWTSTLKLDCSRPDGWDESISNTWLGYVERCAELVKSTEAVLRGNFKSYCNGPITTWGSHHDRRRSDGAIENDWHETLCDRPPQVAGDPPEARCAELRSGDGRELNRELLNSTNCARNYFFSWADPRDRKLAAR